MLPLRSALVASALLFASASSACAIDIYVEDFSGQEGLGATHFGVNSDGVNWTVNPGDAGLFNSDDYFKVSGGRLTARDTNGGCLTTLCATGGASFNDIALPTWLSPIIDVSGWTNLSLSLDAAGSGIFENYGGFNSQDDFIISILLDGVETIVADLVQGSTFINQTVTAAIADGSELQIAVAMNNYAAAEYFYLDNVVVSGTEKGAEPPLESVPEPGLALGLVAFATGARRRNR